MPICQLCQRNCPKLTVHHLMPRQHTKRKKLEVGPTAHICSACHRQVHSLYSNKVLAAELHSIDKLVAEPQMQKFLVWIRKQDPNRKIRTRKPQ